MEDNDRTKLWGKEPLASVYLDLDESETEDVYQLLGVNLGKGDNQ